MQFTAIIAAILPALAAAAPSKAPLESRQQGVSQCTLFGTQFQKNTQGNPTYVFDFRLQNGIQQVIGGVNQISIADFQTFSLTSQLPQTIEIGVGSVDDDPVTIAFNGRVFSTRSGECSTGGYEDGNRDFDCRFEC